MSRTNEKKDIKFHEICKRKFRLDAIVSNKKQRWNEDKCMCDCKELVDKGVCDKWLFGILVIVSLNVINLVILASI